MLKSIHQSLYVRMGLMVFIFHILILIVIILFGLKFSRDRPSFIFSGEVIKLESVVISKVATTQPNLKKQKAQTSESINQVSLDGLEPTNQVLYHSAAAPISMPSADSSALNNPKPPYPISSRENGEQGRVILNACITERGAIHHLELAKTSGYPALDRSALNTVRLWKFMPALQDGHPLPSCYRLPINFILSH